MPKKEIFIRYVLFIVGLWFCSVGISFATKAELGVSPISGVPYVLSIGLPLSMGTFTFIFNMLFVIAQMVLLGKEYEKIQILQIFVLIIFGYFIDLSLWMLSVFNLTSYPQKLIFLLIGCVVLAFGISLQVTANVLILSGEALIKVIAAKLKREFGVVKVFFDTTMVMITTITSFGIFHKLIGVREGTLIAAFSVGFIVRFFNKRLAFINRRLQDK
jgi:uncharacterized protein